MHVQCCYWWFHGHLQDQLLQSLLKNQWDIVLYTFSIIMLQYWGGLCSLAVYKSVWQWLSDCLTSHLDRSRCPIIVNHNHKTSQAQKPSTQTTHSTLHCTVITMSTSVFCQQDIRSMESGQYASDIHRYKHRYTNTDIQVNSYKYCQPINTAVTTMYNVYVSELLSQWAGNSTSMLLGKQLPNRKSEEDSIMSRI